MSLPTAFGVELFDMLRSPASPEQLRFHIDLPTGASLHPDPGGGVNIVDGDGVILGTISRPHALDAQGSEVPVAMSVEGSSIEISVPHRDEEFAYPILVDPEVTIEQNWGQPGWYDGVKLQGLAAWTWYSNSSWIHNWQPEDVQWPGHRGLFIATPNGTLPAGGVGEYIYMARNSATYIKDAVIYPYWRANQSCPSPNPYVEPYDFSGTYDVVQGHWNEVHINDSNELGYSSIPTWGHELVFGMARVRTR